MVYHGQQSITIHGYIVSGWPHYTTETDQKYLSSEARGNCKPQIPDAIEDRHLWHLLAPINAGFTSYYTHKHRFTMKYTRLMHTKQSTACNNLLTLLVKKNQTQAAEWTWQWLHLVSVVFLPLITLSHIWHRNSKLSKAVFTPDTCSWIQVSYEYEQVVSGYTWTHGQQFCHRHRIHVAGDRLYT